MALLLGILPLVIARQGLAGRANVVRASGYFSITDGHTQA